MKFNKRITAAVLAVIMSFSPIGSFLPYGGELPDTVEAGFEGEAMLQILSTADLHGQSTAYNYNTASNRSKGSLAQIVTIAKRLKKELKNGATLMVDSGDDVYGYGAETLMEGTTSGVEYLFKEMLSAGYDAVTLGNHDFDYGFDYIQQELKNSGMKKKVVCANLFHAKTKNPVYDKSKIITKNLTTTTGVKENLKIGVVGAVVPSLTSHYDWKDILSTADIVETVRAESDALKASGCDIVVVLAHTGIGKKNPEAGDDNVGYALTKLPSVDVICTGHSHLNFPSTDENVQTYYDYPGVDYVTGLVNGKILVQEADHGKALGISRLRLQFNDGRATIVGKTVQVRKITSSDKQDSTIVKMNKSYDKKYASQYKKKICDTDYTIANYFGMIEDLPLMQMVNEAKIAYGLRMIDEKLPEYKGYPVIAASYYQVAGTNGSEDYAYIDGTIRKSDLMKFQPNGQEKVKMYTITGAQLRETLEWEAAAAYEKVGYSDEEGWTDGKLSALAGQGYDMVLNAAWTDKWTGLMIYDGIEYTIDMTQNPRYSISGKLIHEGAHRISDLTYNGKPITDTTELILVSRNIAATSRNPVIGKKMKKQTILPKSDYLSEIFEDYIASQTPDGTLHSFLVADDNRSFSCPEGSYVVKTSDSGESYADGLKPWYVQELVTNKYGYGYYTVHLGGERQDTAGPLIVAAPLVKKTTGDPVTVQVVTSDTSGVGRVEYKAGVWTNNDSDWSGAATVAGSFTAMTNGWYTVRAKDKKGNSNIRYVHIENIDPTVSEAPTIDDFTNKMTTITGKASPGGTVYVEAGGVEYTTVADGNGNYSVDVPYQKADSVIRAWQYDTQNRRSAETELTVTRRGGNLPDVYELTNKMNYLKGTLSDSKYSSIVVIHDGYIYVPEEFVDYYKLSKLYSKNRYAIKRVGYKRSGSTYKIELPYFNAGDAVRIYSVDWNGRLSTATNIKVVDDGPNFPKVTNFVIAEEGVVTGKLNTPISGRAYRAFASVDGERTYVDVGSDGKFFMDLGQMEAGTKVRVAVEDEIGGIWRTSAIKEIDASPMTELGDVDTYDVEFDEVDDKMSTVTGLVSSFSGTITMLTENDRFDIQVGEEGEFEYEFDDYLKKDSGVGLILRDSNHEVQIFGCTKVKEAAPEDPEWITEKITEDTTKVKYFCEDRDPAYLKVGGTVYRPAAIVESDARGGYVYVFKIKKPAKGAIVRGWLTNTGGETKRIKLTVKKGKKKKSKETVAAE